MGIARACSNHVTCAFVVLAERLRRETANFMGYARVSSNLTHDDLLSVCPSWSKGTRLGRVIFVCESSNLSADTLFYPYGPMDKASRF